MNTAAGPLVEALHWAMLDFWAIVAAFCAAIFNMIVAIKNFNNGKHILRTMDNILTEDRRILERGGDIVNEPRRPIRDAIRKRRLVRAGETFTTDELADDEVELEEVEPYPEPPVEEQGEPWGWTKPGSRPRGWRLDKLYNPAQRADDPTEDDGR